MKELKMIKKNDENKEERNDERKEEHVKEQVERTNLQNEKNTTGITGNTLEGDNEERKKEDVNTNSPKKNRKIVSYKMPSDVKKEWQLMPTLTKRQKEYKLLQSTCSKMQVQASPDG